MYVRIFTRYHSRSLPFSRPLAKPLGRWGPKDMDVEELDATLPAPDAAVKVLDPCRRQPRASPRPIPARFSAPCLAAAPPWRRSWNSACELAVCLIFFPWCKSNPSLPAGCAQPCHCLTSDQCHSSHHTWLARPPTTGPQALPCPPPAKYPPLWHSSFIIAAPARLPIQTSNPDLQSRLPARD